ncbi:AraC family transcriptional regulator [Methylocystis sp. MJC1]|jgi:AraC-like DNA-binding protein|uniref:helix-turn-helix transcriptional regulator n=1 Tax=Methylocystis sp. MJC1 TaxID=2654282 RepID=UPI0013E9FBE7|nr:AraC family transcriptional regulator [Methylocystis sp. MJC1]KAF2990082.1 Virulence regulon transcriptional activator VirF [Methylocystis sp. MJC1]MBU6527661.1 helix-turn-helix transcriptional regulator [Methylocystis sp. MJC1]UZX10598.1 AraC family transcriptional regulator [Methylocystis sp. MJC1]
MGHSDLQKPALGVATIQAKSPEAAAERLSAMFGQDLSVSLLGSKDAFRLRCTAVRLGKAVLVATETSEVFLRRPPSNAALVFVPLKGAISYKIAGESHSLAAGRNGAIWPPFETVDMQLPQVMSLSLHLPMSAAVAQAERLTGLPFSATPFKGMATTFDLSDPLYATLARNMRLVMSEILALEATGLGQLARAGYDETLQTLATVALFPAVARKISAAARDTGRSPIRKARDYIKAHAAEPVELSRLAVSLGMSMRSLQDNFKKSYGCSPRDYLMECRLENARDRLSLPSDSTSVIEIAMDCGFPDHGQFSSKYRARYGELPSQTLKRARG